MKRIIILAAILIGLMFMGSQPKTANADNLGCYYGQECAFGIYMFNSNLSGSYYAINVYGNPAAYEQLEWYCPGQYISCYGYGGTYASPYVQWSYYVNAFGTGYVSSHYCFDSYGYAAVNSGTTNSRASAQTAANNYAKAHGGKAGPAVLVAGH